VAEVTHLIVGHIFLDDHFGAGAELLDEGWDESLTDM
jgi:hypothetical protein